MLTRDLRRPLVCKGEAHGKGVIIINIVVILLIIVIVIIIIIITLGSIGDSRDATMIVVKAPLDVAMIVAMTRMIAIIFLIHHHRCHHHHHHHHHHLPHHHHPFFTSHKDIKRDVRHHVQCNGYYDDSYPGTARQSLSSSS